MSDEQVLRDFLELRMDEPVDNASSANSAASSEQDLLVSIARAERCAMLLNNVWGLADITLGQSVDDTSARQLLRRLDAEPAAPPEFLGRFRVDGTLGRGAFGQVYLAYDEQLERQVAIKVPHASSLPAAEQMANYLAEAQSVAGLDHPNIVPVYDVGQTDECPCYIVCKYVPGTTLAGIAAAPGPGRFHQVVALIATVSEALHYAHSRGLTHRDVKPSNILVDVDGQPHLVDFGLALRESEIGRGPHFVGTAAYMSPEQAQGAGHRVDGRSDVYSLGVVLYERLAGRLPFVCSSRDEMLNRITSERPARLREVDGTVPAELERICMKALAKHPVDRYSTARELSDDLRYWLSQQQAKSERRRRFALVAAGLALFLVLASIAGYEVNGRFRSAALIDSLAHAEADAVLEIADQLSNYRRWSYPRLQAGLTAAPQTPADDRRQLHARVALVREDGSQVEPLVRALLGEETSVPHVRLLVSALEPHRLKVVDNLWEIMQKRGAPLEHRFRAGLALANYAPRSGRWTDADRRLLVDQLTTYNPEHQPVLRALLRPVRAELLAPLERVFADSKRPIAQMGAASGLADFAQDDGARLARLVSEATPSQHRILYAVVAAAQDAELFETLETLAAERPPPPSPTVSSALRIALGKRRSGAAITLLRRGASGGVFHALSVHDDINALTQFVRGCRERDVRPEKLIECLDVADERRERTAAVTASTSDTSSAESATASGRAGNDLVFGLLLALGEFSLDELPDEQRQPLLQRLVDWYAHDPSAAIHAACGWLLRHWGQAELARRIDQTPVPYAPDRGWFTLQLPASSGLAETPLKAAAAAGSLQSDLIHLTFVVVPAGDYKIPAFSTGTDWFLLSPHGDPMLVPGGGMYGVTVARPFAILDREITFEELAAFGAEGFRNDVWREPVENRAALGVSWYDSVHFCRWLTAQRGLDKSEQAYPPAQSLAAGAIDDQGNVTDWPVDLEQPGFRLPTVGEYHIAAYAGLHQYWSFGQDKAFTADYGFFSEGVATAGPRPPRIRRPNLYGMFDMEGNVIEWCHDRLPESPAQTPDTDDVRPTPFSRLFMKSTHQNGWAHPASQNNRMGFRIALTLPE